MGVDNYGILVMENQRFPGFCGFITGEEKQSSRRIHAKHVKKLDYSSVYYYYF
jgi:hypothetical protein